MLHRLMLVQRRVWFKYFIPHKPDRSIMYWSSAEERIAKEFMEKPFRLYGSSAVFAITALCLKEVAE